MESPIDAIPEYSVSRLTREIRSLLESSFPRCWVEGEVSNFKRHSSGHCYFTLKDERAQLRCVMFRSDARTLRFRPADGMQVRAGGYVSVYPDRGDYQLIVRRVLPAGEGELRKAFEELKRRLSAEGLFDVARKRPLPALPAAIGVVTSSDGAALRDIVTVLERRFPVVTMILRPTPVQGPGASAEIAHAIRDFGPPRWPASRRPVDVLIVGRGGGSEEDLWAFNEEIVARAIFESPIPIISAVGHETDVSIADLVADVRAPTPSAAAEMAVPDARSLLMRIDELRRRLTTLVRRLTDLRRQRLTALLKSHGLNHPLVRLRIASQRLDELTTRTRRAVVVRTKETRLKIESLAARLESLDPRRPMSRGFVLLEREGSPVTSAKQLQKGDDVDLRFQDGRRQARVTD